MSTESFNRTSDNIETPSIKLDVLKQKKETQKSKKVCFNKLNHKLHLSQKKRQIKKYRDYLFSFFNYRVARIYCRLETL